MSGARAQLDERVRDGPGELRHVATRYCMAMVGMSVLSRSGGEVARWPASHRFGWDVGRIRCPTWSVGRRCQAELPAHWTRTEAVRTISEGAIENGPAS